MRFDPRSIQRKRRTVRLAAAKLKGRHTKQEWLDLKRFYGGRCVRCGLRDDGDYEGMLAKDHVVEIHQGGCDCIGNIQPLCAGCNSRKNGRKGESWDFRQIAKERWNLRDG